MIPPSASHQDEDRPGGEVGENRLGPLEIVGEVFHSSSVGTECASREPLDEAS